MPALPNELSPGDWAVLGALAEGPTHGFAVAKLMAPDGALGRIWTLARPLVYRSLQKLVDRGLASMGPSQPGGRGPARNAVMVTAEGRRAVEAWLLEPVAHVRDMRSLFLLKLALLDRAGADPSELLRRQHEQLRPQIEALREQCRRADGFERVLSTWRLESSEAAMRLLTKAGR